MTEHILNRLFAVPFGKTQSVQKFKTAGAEIAVKEMDIDDMRTEFPKLVRGGQFVNAMVVIQGHTRFLWFYSLVERITRLLSGKGYKERAAAKADQEGLPLTCFSHEPEQHRHCVIQPSK